MKIFISYAHVDLPRIQKLAEFLRMAGHDVWYDQRLVGGQPWRDQLRAQIKTSDRFIYALTPESVASAWCRWEFAQAVHMGKPIVPALLEACQPDNVCQALGDLQYIDFTAGDTMEVGVRLATAIFAAGPISPESVPLLPAPDDRPPEREVSHTTGADVPLVRRLYDEAYQHYRDRRYDDARELVEDLLHIAPGDEQALKLLALIERRMAKRPETPPPETPPPPQPEADSPPTAITEPPTHTSSKKPTLRGVQALLPAPFAWVDIPAGKVTLKAGGYLKADTTFDVPAFSIARYPVTNAQFAKFVEAGGYRERQWWTEAGWEAREQEGWAAPRYWTDSVWNGADQPVVGVSWYEAVAFCRWLSATTGERIMLPTEGQWQRAAQGDDGRAYPWGNEWDCERCNNSVSPCDSNITTPVTQYEGERKGDSFFGVTDMAGNVWEWCLTAYETGSESLEGENGRVLRGGSWHFGDTVGFRCDYRDRYFPQGWDDTGGFRISRS